MERRYLILDSQGEALAHGILESAPTAEVLQLRILNGEEKMVTAHRELQLIGMDDGSPNRIGIIIKERGDRIVIQPTAALAAAARENLRIQTNFRSVIYPLSGKWAGRRDIKAKDLSCGGVAFYCAQPLELNEAVELVLPVTDEPLILTTQILRIIPSQTSTPQLYATKFIGLIPDEEALIRKAVFSIQIRQAK